MVFYIHGSQDSIDKDVIYIFDEMPDYNTCRAFCSEDPTENRNIITIKNGIVDQCFIGTPDEINNALLVTYSLHEQKHPLLITQKVERDITQKEIRAIRGILSILSRTQYRPDIKEALKTGWKLRLECLYNIDFTKINFNELQKRMDCNDLLKVIAFQLGQTIGLIEGIELYTKKDIVKQFPDLESFLYRKKGDLNILNDYKDILVNYLYEKEVVDLGNNTVYFKEENRTIDLKHEKTIPNKDLER